MGAAQPLSPSTKNALREWFLQGRTGDFTVTVDDARVKSLDGRLEEIREKIRREEDLTQEEEERYQGYMRALQTCRREAALKQQACVFCLRDDWLQGYFLIDSYLKLWDWMENILNYDACHGVYQKMNDASYTALDVYLDPPPEECHDHFVVPLKREKVKEVFGDITSGHIWGDAADLGHELLKEASVYYYRFLAEEVIVFHMEGIVENKRAMNLLHYRIGLH